MIDLTSLYFENLCLSGGAKGADLQWGMCAGSAGHSVIHWSFAGHRSQAPHAEIVELNEEQLQVADPFLEVANKTLMRRIPENPFSRNLLRRNYYQVAWSQSLYAVSTISSKTNKVEGGTAWAVQMFIDRGQELPCYVFDQASENWKSWDYATLSWVFADPSKPSGLWAGVGSRELTLAGKTAIRNLMGYITAN